VRDDDATIRERRVERRERAAHVLVGQTVEAVAANPLIGEVLW